MQSCYVTMKAVLVNGYNIKRCSPYKSRLLFSLSVDQYQKSNYIRYDSVLSNKVQGGLNTCYSHYLSE